MYRALSVATTLALLAAPAAAQSRSNEAAGPPAPSGMLASAPARKMPSDPRERALWQAADAIRNDANAGALSRPNARKPVPLGAAQAVVAVMSEPSGEDETQLRYALMMSGRGEGDANGLIGSLAHVLSDPSTGRTKNAREHLDDFMKDASESFRVNPPAEIQAIDAVLARLAAADQGFVADQRNAKAEREAARKAQREEAKRAAAAKKSSRSRSSGTAKARAEKARADSIKAEKARAEQAKKEAEEAAKIRADSVKAEQQHAEAARADSAKAEQQHAEAARADGAKAASRQARSQVTIKKYSQPQPAAKP